MEDKSFFAKAMEDKSFFAKAMEDTSADVFLPSARCARSSDFAAFGHAPASGEPMTFPWPLGAFDDRCFARLLPTFF